MRRRSCLQTVPDRDEASSATVYTLSGKLVGRRECFEFLEDVREDIENGFIHVILQMENLAGINSTGIGILAAMVTSTQRRNGKVYVVQVPARVQHFLEISHLLPFLVTCDTVADALGRAAEATVGCGPAD